MVDVVHMFSPQPRKENAPLSFRWFVNCDDCDGRGWFFECVPGTENYLPPDYNERYCDCEAGKWRRVYDGGTTDEAYKEST